MHRIRALGAACILALLASLAIAAPAQASPLSEQYEMVTGSGTPLPGVFWVDEELGIVGCTQCVHWFDLRSSIVLDARTQAAVFNNVINGLTDLSDTTVTTNKSRIANLRAAALGQFTGGASMLGSAVPAPGPVGSYNPKTGATKQISTPWLTSADKHIVTGLKDLQSSFLDPEPSPWIVAATAQFDDAYQAISEKEAVS